MGYNITITSTNTFDYEEKTLYFTGNHTLYFEKLDIEPEDFNGMPVKEIIPYYMKAKRTLEDEHKATNGFIDDLSQEYSGKYWERDDPDVVLGVVNNTQHTYPFN